MFAFTVFLSTELTNYNRERCKISSLKINAEAKRLLSSPFSITAGRYSPHSEQVWNDSF